MSEEVPDARRHLGLGPSAGGVPDDMLASRCCHCGHPRDTHPGLSICVACGFTKLSNGQYAPNGFCMGWDPQRAPATTAAPTNPQQIADERDHFQAAMHRMREALTGLRQGRLTGEQANDEFFDGYQQTKQAFASALLARDIKHAALAELAVLRHSNTQMRDLTREQDQAIQALRDKVADLEVYAAELHEALEAIAAHFADEVAFPGSPLGKVRDALAAQPPQHRQQLLGYQTSDGRLYQPEDITLVYALDQGETARDGDR